MFFRLLEKFARMLVVWVVIAAIAGLCFGYLAGAGFGFGLNQRRSLAINVGMQNAGMGAVLAIKHISPEAAIPNAIFAVWCIISAVILAEIWSKAKN